MFSKMSWFIFRNNFSTQGHQLESIGPTWVFWVGTGKIEKGDFAHLGKNINDTVKAKCYGVKYIGTPEALIRYHPRKATEKNNRKKQGCEARHFLNKPLNYTGANPT